MMIVMSWDKLLPKPMLTQIYVVCQTEQIEKVINHRHSGHTACDNFELCILNGTGYFKAVVAYKTYVNDIAFSRNIWGIVEEFLCSIAGSMAFIKDVVYHVDKGHRILRGCIIRR